MKSFLPLPQHLLNLRQLRLQAVQMLLHVVYLLLGLVVNRKINVRLVLIPRFTCLVSFSARYPRSPLPLIKPIVSATAVFVNRSSLSPVV